MPCRGVCKSTVIKLNKRYEGNYYCSTCSIWIPADSDGLITANNKLICACCRLKVRTKHAKSNKETRTTNAYLRRVYIYEVESLI